MVSSRIATIVLTLALTAGCGGGDTVTARTPAEAVAQRMTGSAGVKVTRLVRLDHGDNAFTPPAEDDGVVPVDLSRWNSGLGPRGRCATDGGGPRTVAAIGIDDVRQEIAMLRTPDGHGRVELAMFHTPKATAAGPQDAPANTLGIRRVMFAVDDIEDVVARLRAHRAELVGELVRYEDSYRLCYVRGPEGIVVGLSEQLDRGSSQEPARS